MITHEILKKLFHHFGQKIYFIEPLRQVGNSEPSTFINSHEIITHYVVINYAQNQEV